MLVIKVYGSITSKIKNEIIELSNRNKSSVLFVSSEIYNLPGGKDFYFEVYHAGTPADFDTLNAVTALLSKYGSYIVTIVYSQIILPNSSK